MKPFVVVVYGPVGVGKSTVIQQLNDTTIGSRHVLSVREPIDAIRTSGALQAVGKSMPSSGFDVQMMILAERMSSYWQAQARVRREQGDTIIVADGYINLDAQIFANEHRANGRMSVREWQRYHIMLPLMVAQCPEFMQRPDMYVYLDASPDICLTRVSNRGRVEEQALSLTNLRQLCAACEGITERLASENSTKVVRILTDWQSPETVFTAVQDAIKHEVATL